MSKQCKQCGRLLSEHNFRPYKSRSKGTYKTSVGTNTICKECESFNSRINYLFRTKPDSPLLESAAEFYKELAAKGYEPKGAYAKHVLGCVDTNRTDAAQSYMDAILKPKVNAAVMREFDELMTMDLTDEPDVYQDMLDEVRSKCVGADGRVRNEYLSIFNQVSTRIDEYEDNYQW